MKDSPRVVCVQRPLQSIHRGLEPLHSQRGNKEGGVGVGGERGGGWGGSGRNGLQEERGSAGETKININDEKNVRAMTRVNPSQMNTINKIKMALQK